MGNIRMNYQGVEDKARGFEMDSEEMRDLIRRVENRYQSLGEDWEGESSRAFEAMLTQMTPKLYEMSDLMKVVAQDIRKASDAYQSLDSGLAGNFKA